MYDVIIIGGGPAGSTTASYLAMSGRQVLLLEKEKFPRPHVGESLLPFCYDLLKDLGVLEHMKTNYVRKPGVRFIDKDGAHSTTWCFDHVIHDESYLSFQVLRAKFDDMLLKNARRLGVTALEEMRVDKVELNGSNDRIAVRAIDTDGLEQTFEGKFIVDCSGRNALLASSMGKRKKYPDLDRTALATHFSGANYVGGVEEGLTVIVYLGGEKKGWIWVFPLEPDRVTVGVVLNNEYIRSQRAKMSAMGVKDWKQALFDQEINDSTFVSEILTKAKRIEPLIIEGDYSYYSEQKFGDNFAMVGDAATFIDPIFASGVFLALKSSKLVADGVHKRLAGINGQRDPLAEAYDQIEGAYKLVHRLINYFYSADVINFAQMGSATELIFQQHKDALATSHYMLAGDFFDRYDFYEKVINSLQKPHLFEKYRELIIERPSFQSATCNNPEEIAFPTKTAAPI